MQKVSIALLTWNYGNEYNDELYMTFKEEYVSSDRFEVINSRESPKCVGLETEYNHMSSSVDIFQMETCALKVIQHVHVLNSLMQELQTLNQE